MRAGRRSEQKGGTRKRRPLRKWQSVGNFRIQGIVRHKGTARALVKRGHHPTQHSSRHTPRPPPAMKTLQAQLPFEADLFSVRRPRGRRNTAQGCAANPGSGVWHRLVKFDTRLLRKAERTMAEHRPYLDLVATSLPGRAFAPQTLGRAPPWVGMY